MTIKRLFFNRTRKTFVRTAVIFLLLAVHFAWAAGGGLSGTLKDQSGAVVPDANLTLTNTALKTEFKATSGAQGLYSFQSLAVGQYDLTIEAKGFQPQKKRGL